MPAVPDHRLSPGFPRREGKDAPTFSSTIQNMKLARMRIIHRKRKDDLPTICELARLVGVNRSTLSRIFQGLRHCSPELRAKIEAHGYAVPPCRVPKGV